MSCPACGHVHLGRANCYQSSARDHLCVCKTPQGETMPKGNGKDEDGFENVDGKATKASPILGLRVVGAAIMEGKDGAARSRITVSGYTKGLVGMLGQDLGIKSATLGNEFLGKLVGVSVRLGKDDRPIWTSKVAGARDLDRLVGMQIRMEATQGQLALNDERDSLEPPPPPKPHGKRGARRSADGGPWQGSPKRKGRKGAEKRA